MNKDAELFASRVGIATFVTAYCALLMSRLNRACESADIFMSIVLTTGSLLCFLLFIRLPWKFICKHAIKFNQTNEDFFKKLFCLCGYDVFPLTIIVIIACWFDFNVELLLLPIITIAVIALVLKFYDKRKFSKKTQIVYFVSNAVILVIMGFWVSLGSNENVTMALTFARFMMVAGPIALLFKCSKLFYLPTAVIVVEKLLYGNFSTLDTIFIPCNFLISAVFALAMARINRA